MIEHQRQGTVDLVRPDDAVMDEAIGNLEKLLEEFLGRGQPRVVIDLQKTPMIDGAGLELLLKWRDRYAECGGMLKLASPNALCNDILRVTGLDDEFDVHNESVSALASFAQ